MTVNRLLKLCEEAIASGHGRAAVCIDKPTFTHPLEGDGACILDTYHAGVESVPQMDDDGGTHAAYTQIVNPTSLYRITPTTEEIARSVARHSRPAAIN